MHNEEKSETEETYRAVATGYAIYGLGKDEAEAITDAKQWVESEYEDNLEDIIVRDKPQYNDFTIIKISRAVKEHDKFCIAYSELFIGSIDQKLLTGFLVFQFDKTNVRKFLFTFVSYS